MRLGIERHIPYAVSYGRFADSVRRTRTSLPCVTTRLVRYLPGPESCNNYGRDTSLDYCP
ncbi:hypothetical protein J6590_060801 [Homalodisca vitripennis]|nr:hypothetical protein J6590_060801 [Homalodisca vitripennis]